MSPGGGLFIEGEEGPSFTVVEDSPIKNNRTATSLGGGIYSSAQKTVQSTKIIGNQTDQGAAVYNDRNKTVTLFSTKIVKNIAVTDGGASSTKKAALSFCTPPPAPLWPNRPNNRSGDVPSCAG